MFRARILFMRVYLVYFCDHRSGTRTSFSLEKIQQIRKPKKIRFGFRRTYARRLI